jgi:WW domain-containing oxidoreductase
MLILCIALVIFLAVVVRVYWHKSPLPQHILNNTELLRGKVILITGATAGIGLATAKALHKMGAHIVFGARDITRAQKAIKEIQGYRSITGKPAPQIDYLELDLASLDSVRQFVTEFKKLNLPIHFMINNAAGVFRKCGVTSDGFERHWQINVLSHFLLNTLLLDEINTSKARVITLTSDGHRETFVKDYTPLTYQQVHSDMSDSHGARLMGTYGLSKLNGIHFYNEFQRRVADGVLVVGANPGYVKTELSRESPFLIAIVLRVVEFLIAKTPLQGAYTTLKLVLARPNDLVKGGYYENCALSSASAVAENQEYQKQLWELCEECVRK